MSSHSGSLSFLEDCIRYRGSSAYAAWELRIDQIRVIGERTHGAGPGTGDWFLCFGTPGGRWFEASMCAEGAIEFPAKLSARLGQPISLELQLSFDCADRVVWPPTHVGRPLFKSVRIEHPSLWQRVSVLSWYPTQQVLSDDVVALIDR